MFQLGTAGIFIINGATADLGGAGTLALTNGLQISAGSITTLSSDKTLAGPGALTNLGTLDLNSRTLTAATAPVFVGTNLTAINRNGGSPLAGKIVLSSGTLTYGGVLTATNSGATLTGGEVFDLFDATTFTGAFTATNLPALGAGLNWWTGSLTNNGTIKVNRSPVATNLTLGVSVGAANTLQIIGGKNSPTDADADVLAVAAVTPGANGTVSFTSTNVTYTSTNSAGSDSFTYTVSDGFGGTATGTVNVSTYSAEGFNRLLPVGSISNGIFNLSYLGIPGTNYALDWATNLTPPINWVGLVTNQAATNGYLLFSVTNSGDVNFFRTRYAP